MTDFEGSSAFLITKPLQLMVALSILRQSKWASPPSFLIADTFEDAEAVFARLPATYGNDLNAKFFLSQKEAYRHLGNNSYTNVFIDSDVGAKKFLMLSLFKLRNIQSSIYVYEEGVGTYRTDLYAGWKAKLFDYIGIATYFGGCRFTDSIFVFDPIEYEQKFARVAGKVRRISTTLEEFLVADGGKLNSVFGFQGESLGKQCSGVCKVYLSAWAIDEKFLEYFTRLPGDLYIKPHPHILGTILPSDIAIIASGVPAELVVKNLLERYEFIEVFDHRSSVRQYIKSKRISFECVDDILRPLQPGPDPKPNDQILEEL